jgi:nucleoside-diphosphate-sugar epimerase
MKVFVSGAAGFIGSHLVRRALNEAACLRNCAAGDGV